MQNVVLGYAKDPQFDRKEAVRLVRLALSIDDSDPETLARASVISAFMVGDSEAEIEMADRAVALNPNSWSTWNGRGWVYNYAGLPEEAIRSFERAIRMSPVDPRLYPTLIGIGQALIELRRFDEAIVVLKKALRQNPSNSGTYRCLASAFAHLGRDAEAHAAAARVLEMDPAFTISTLIAGSPKTQSCLLRVFGKRGCPNKRPALCGRCDRMTASGRTKQTWRDVRLESAMHTKAEVHQCLRIYQSLGCCGSCQGC